MSSQRSFVALMALLGAFLVPFFVSSMRGLSFPLTCEEPLESNFVLLTPADSPPVILSARQIEKGETSPCEGLDLQMEARGLRPRVVEIIVEISNETALSWAGSVSLLLEGDRTLPIDIGKIESGETARSSITLDLERGRHQLQGSLLIGP